MERTALTESQLEAERILSNVADIPRGGKVLLADLAQDGFGGMIVYRTERGNWMFAREFYYHRSRFADNLAQCMEEIEFYLASGGRLSGPDKRSWF